VSTKPEETSRLRLWFRRRFRENNGWVFLLSARKAADWFRALHVDGLEGKDAEELRVYRTLGAWVLGWPRSTKDFSSLIVVKTFGRLGNHVFQLVHAIHCARQLGVLEVLAPGNQSAPERVFTTPGGIRVDTRIASFRQPSKKNLPPGLFKGLRPKTVASSRFFDLSHFPALGGDVDHAEIFRDLREAGLWKSDLSPLETDHLVIHIRGGDIFVEDPNPYYGQPPLAYYERIISSREWSEITIVSQDFRNPVTAVLLQRLNEAGLPHRFQSGTLEEDVSLLLRARTLVAGKGTFIPAIVGLSEAIETAYVFGELKRLRSDITIKIVNDVAGTYWNAICQKNWSAAHWQLKMMVEYPLANLEFAIESA